MTEHFVTIFDQNYLPQGLALWRSLERHLQDFVLWVVCVDEDCFNTLQKINLKNVRPLKLADLETNELIQVKKDRSRAEYCWTLTPFTPRFVFDCDPSIERVTYIDADVWLANDISEIFQEFTHAGKDVLITEHAYDPEYDQATLSGRFCVQFIIFNNSKNAEIVRSEWASQCIEWCYGRYEDGKFGDQKYLDEWPNKFSSIVHILCNQSWMQGPWNTSAYSPLNAKCHHFHGLRLTSDSSYVLNEFYKIPLKTRYEIYGPYSRDLGWACSLLKSHGFGVPTQYKLTQKELKSRSIYPILESLNLPVRVLHINIGDRKGGAARSAYRLHEALLINGVQSQFFSPASSYPATDNLKLNSMGEKFKFRVSELIDYSILRWISKRNAHLGLTSAGLANRINKLNVDVVHLHWVSGLVSIFDIKAIKKPIVWTTHDSWPIQGIEYLPKENSFKNRLLSAISNLILNLKKHIWVDSHLHFVTPSLWMFKRASGSPVVANKSIHHIPNALSFSSWQPIEKAMSRRLLNIPTESKVILMSAYHWSQDQNKGMDLLIQSLNVLPPFPESILILVIGEDSHVFKLNNSSIIFRVMGKIDSDDVIKQCISASDVVVVPSRCENFPNSALEALALGIPVVAFNSGGTIDMVEHRCNGWLAKSYDVNDFSAGITWALKDFQKNNAIKLCRDKVREISDESLVAEKHISLYQKILSIYPMSFPEVNDEQKKPN